MKRFLVLISAVCVISFSAAQADASMILSLSGGYNFAAGDTIDMFDAVYAGIDDKTKGGGAVHLDLWFGTDMFQFGASLGYTGLYSIDDSFYAGADFIEYKAHFAYIPISVQARVFPLGGFYVGALAGYYYPIITQEAKINGVKQPDVSDTGDYQYGIGLMTGYEIALIDFLVLGVQIRYQLVMDGDDVNHNTALMLTAGLKF